MPWSQKNARVDIVVPGADILSTYPRAKSAAAGSTLGALSFGNVSLNSTPGAFFSGAGTVRAALADCGYGESKCEAAKGGICLVQGRKRAGGAASKGGDDVVSDGAGVPSTCELVQYCIDQGAKAVVLVPPAEVPGFGPFPRDVSRGAIRRRSAGAAPLQTQPARAPGCRRFAPPGRRRPGGAAPRLPGWWRALGRSGPASNSGLGLRNARPAETPAAGRGRAQPRLHLCRWRRVPLLDRRPREALGRREDAARGGGVHRPGRRASRGREGRRDGLARDAADAVPPDVRDLHGHVGGTGGGGLGGLPSVAAGRGRGQGGWPRPEGWQAPPRALPAVGLRPGF